MSAYTCLDKETRSEAGHLIMTLTHLLMHKCIAIKIFVKHTHTHTLPYLVPTPIGPSVAKLEGILDEDLTELGLRKAALENCQDPTHYINLCRPVCICVFMYVCGYMY